MKNLFGRGVPMSRLLEDAERLVQTWANIHEQLDAFRRKANSSLTGEEASYFDLLSRYAMAVRETVHALVARQRLLNDGSLGGRKNPMTWELFQERERLYKSAVAHYMLIGRDLNAAASTIFD